MHITLDFYYWTPSLINSEMTLLLANKQPPPRLPQKGPAILGGNLGPEKKTFTPPPPWAREIGAICQIGIVMGKRCLLFLFLLKLRTSPSFRGFFFRSEDRNK